MGKVSKGFKQPTDGKMEDPKSPAAAVASEASTLPHTVYKMSHHKELKKLKSNLKVTKP